MKNKLKVSLKHINDVRVKLGLDPHEAPIVKKEIKVKETFIEEFIDGQSYKIYSLFDGKNLLTFYYNCDKIYVWGRKFWAIK